MVVDINTVSGKASLQMFDLNPMEMENMSLSMNDDLAVRPDSKLKNISLAASDIVGMQHMD